MPRKSPGIRVAFAAGLLEGRRLPRVKRDVAGPQPVGLADDGYKLRPVARADFRVIAKQAYIVARGVEGEAYALFPGVRLDCVQVPGLQAVQKERGHAQVKLHKVKPEALCGVNRLGIAAFIHRVISGMHWHSSAAGGRIPLPRCRARRTLG